MVLGKHRDLCRHFLCQMVVSRCQLLPCDIFKGARFAGYVVPRWVFILIDSLVRFPNCCTQPTYATYLVSLCEARATFSLSNFRQPYLWEHSSYLAKKKSSMMQCRKYLDSFFRFYVFLFFALTSFDTQQIQRQTSAGSLLAVTICYNPSLL